MPLMFPNAPNVSKKIVFVRPYFLNFLDLKKLIWKIFYRKKGKKSDINCKILMCPSLTLVSIIFIFKSTGKLDKFAFSRRNLFFIFQNLTKKSVMKLTTYILFACHVLSVPTMTKKESSSFLTSIKRRTKRGNNNDAVF